jgi:hypothetical protein
MTTPTKRTPAKGAPAEPTQPNNNASSITAEDVERRHVQAYGSGVESVAMVPELSVSLQAKHLPVVSNPTAEPFVLLWNPACWAVDGRKRRRLVPMLRNFALKPGSSGVARGHNGRPDVTQGARENWEARGYRAIPYELGPGGSYVRQIRVDPTGSGKGERNHFCTAWETYYSGVRNSITDYDGYLDWIGSLVTRGHIAGCQLPIAVALLQDLVSKRDKASERAKSGNITAGEQVKRLESDIQIVNDYIEAIAPSVPAPDAVAVESSIPDLGGVA